MNKAFEKIVEILEELRETYDEMAFIEMNTNGHTLDFEYAKGKKDVMLEVRKIVQEVAEEYNGGWIACSERLPKGSMNNVLCQFYDGRIDTISMEHLRYEVNNESGYCVAWQPLPEPFKERDSD